MRLSKLNSLFNKLISATSLQRSIAVAMIYCLLMAFVAPTTLDSAPIRRAKLEQLSSDCDVLIRQAKTPTEPLRLIVQVDARDDGPDLSALDDQLLVPPSQHKRADNALIDSIRRSGGRILRANSYLGSLVVDLPANKVRALATGQGVRWISPDRPARALASHIENTTGAAAARISLGGIQQLDGTGITIAVLDTGVALDHVGFKSLAPGSLQLTSGSRILTGVDMTGSTLPNPAADRHGHGTHVAGIAAGIDPVNNLYEGIAPHANIVSVKVLGDDGTGTTSTALAGLNWVLANASTYNIRVVNMSLGVLSPDSYQTDVLCQAAERLVSSGIVVVVAGGNYGLPPGSVTPQYGLITSPGADPAVITVGSANTRSSDSRVDDSVNNFSSRGPTRGHVTTASGTVYDNVAKPDIIAPGNRIVSAEADDSFLITHYPSLHVTGGPLTSYMTLSGTSMAAPVVAGAAALLLQANGGLVPGLIKAIFQYTAHPITGNLYDQGTGELNVEGAVRLAQAIRPDIAALQPGNPLLAGPMPAMQSSFAGDTFAWAGFIVGGGGYILSGTALFQSYQLVYRPGIVWVGNHVSDSKSSNVGGILITPGVSFTTASGFSSGGLLVTAGSLLIDGITVSGGVTAVQGVTLAQGTSLAEGVTLAEGVALAESILQAEVDRIMIQGEL